MKNLFKTRRTKIYLGIIASAVFAVTIALFANFKPSLFRNASAANDYTITFNRNNGGAGFPSSYGSGTNSSGHTSRGNQISFTYNNAKSTSGKFCTLANGGYLYNLTAITGLESVEIGFSGGSLSLYSSKSTTFDGDAESLTTESALSIAANYDYFKLVASGETAIEYIKVFYTCSAREEQSYYVKVNETSQVTSGQYLIVYESGSVALNLQTEEDVANNGTSVTIVEDKIESTSATDVLAFTLDDTNGSLLAPCGKYITHTGSKNTLNFSDSAVGHDISVEDGVANIEVTSQSYHIAYNNNTDQKRFRYYLNSAANVALFKLNGESGGGTVVTNYTITYMSNGGTGTMEPTSGTNPVVASCSFTAPSGQEFSKWNTAANGSGTDVAVGTALSADTTLYAIWEASSSGGSSTFELFSGTIEEGDYIITYDDCAMNTTVTSTRLQYYSVTPVNDVITDPSDDIIWHIAKSGNYWTLYNEEVEAYVASTGAKNKAQMLEDGTDDKSLWSITGSETYEFVNKQNASSGVNANLRKNGTYGFACYSSSTGGELTLYKSVEATPQGPISVSGVSLNHVSAEITNETGIQLSATISPNNATNQNVSWSSDKPGIASVDQSGNVTGVSAGTAIITVTTEDGNKTATCEVTVTMIVHVTGVSLDHTSLDLHPGEQDSLTATVSPSNASNKNVTWSTNASSVATVNNGTVTAVSAGTATITITTVDGSKTAQCTVTVTNIAVTGISLNKNSLTLDRPGSETLTATIAPSNASNKNVNWSSGNTNVATVSGGTVTAVGTGTTIITATSAADNTKYATCTVTVNPVNVSSVSLNKNALSLGVGAKETLTATVSPSNADNTNINWSTSDSGVATVTNGEVTGVAAGTATITATSAADSSKKATCTVTVTSQSPVSSYTIEFKVGTGDGSTLSDTTENSTYIESGSEYVNSISYANKVYGPGSYGLKLGASSSAGSLTLSIDSTEVSTIVVNAKLYRSDKSATLDVNSTGAQSVGSSFTDYTYTIDDTITSITLGSTKYIWISGVTVNIKNSTPINPTSISIDPSSLELGKGGNRNLIVNYTPSNANQNKEVTWTRYSGSSNISVDQNGLVTVSSNASVGNSAVIRATLTNLTSIYAQCTVTVTDVQKAKYTVLLYLCGSTLEYGKNNSGNYQLWGSATDDMREILNASGTYKSDVNIVVETGGSKKWETTYGVSKDKLEVRHVSGSSYVKDSPSTITTQANMGEASTLQTFLEYGLTTYPADKTALILWDHGGAMTGVCCDDNYSMECLTAAEVKSAVSGALSNCGMSGQKLEWIGYDACLMGVADIASINSDYFNYMVASQESEPGDGWDYTTWVSSLYNNPTNTRTVLDSITTSYRAQYVGGTYTNDATLAAYDLSCMSAFTTAFENFASHVSGSWSGLTTAYDNSLKFGIDDDNDYMYGIADMKSFINNANTQINGISTYTSAVLTALNNLVIYNKYCTAYTSSTGYPCGVCVFIAHLDNSYKPYTRKAEYTTNDTKFTTWRNINISNGSWGS